MEKDKKIYNLFLDDIRMPNDVFLYIKKELYLEKDWVIVRSYNVFVEYILANGLPELISFDHDLADEHYAPREHWHRYDDWAKESNFKENTGYDCALWLVAHCLDNELKLPNYLCHSMNPVGYDNILGLLDNYRKHEENKI